MVSELGGKVWIVAGVKAAVDPAGDVGFRIIAEDIVEGRAQADFALALGEGEGKELIELGTFRRRVQAATALEFLEVAETRMVIAGDRRKRQAQKPDPKAEEGKKTKTPASHFGVTPQKRKKKSYRERGAAIPQTREGCQRFAGLPRSPEIRSKIAVWTSKACLSKGLASAWIPSVSKEEEESIDKTRSYL